MTPPKRSSTNGTTDAAIDRRFANFDKGLDGLKNDLDKRFTELKADITDRRNSTKWLAGFVLTVLLGWLGVGTNYILMMHGDIKALRQSLKDHGLGDVVAGIQSSDPSVARANLTLLSGEIQIAQVNQKRSDPNRLVTLSNAVAKASLVHPALPETWQVAAQLVTFRSASSSTTSTSYDNNCYDAPFTVVNQPDVQHLRPGHTMDDNIVWAKCTIVIDDLDAFNHSQFGQIVLKDIETMKSLGRLEQYLGAHVAFDHVRVIYRGGKPIPAASFTFRNCTFIFEPSSQLPPLRGKELTRQLLTADLTKSEVSFSST